MLDVFFQLTLSTTMTLSHKSACISNVNNVLLKKNTLNWLYHNHKLIFFLAIRMTNPAQGVIKEERKAVSNFYWLKTPPAPSIALGACSSAFFGRCRHTLEGGLRRRLRGLRDERTSSQPISDDGTRAHSISFPISHCRTFVTTFVYSPLVLI